MIIIALRDILIKIKGENKEFKKSLNDSDKSMSGFASKMKAHSGAIVLAAGVMAAGFVAFAAKAAAAEEVVTRQTEALLKAQGVMWNDVGSHIDTYLKKLEELTSYNDTDLQIAFNRLIALGMDYNTAMDTMTSVTNLAYTMNMSLETSATLLGKAYKGQTDTLSRYGIVLKEGLTDQEKYDEIIRITNEDMADATERGNTLTGSIDNLNNQFHNMAEILGSELLPPLTDFMNILTDIVTSDAFQRIMGGIMGIGKSAYALSQIFGIVYNSVASVIELFKGNKDAAQEFSDKAEEGARKLVKGFQDAYTEYEKLVMGIKEKPLTSEEKAQAAHNIIAGGGLGVAAPTAELTPSNEPYKRSAAMEAISKGVTMEEFSGKGVKSKPENKLVESNENLIRSNEEAANTTNSHISELQDNTLELKLNTTAIKKMKFSFDKVG